MKIITKDVVERIGIRKIEDFIFQIREKIGQRSESHEFFYRGHADAGYTHNLTPGIYRNGNIKNEHIIFKEIISRSPAEFFNEKTALEKLVKMRHYELPTRLLDISSNPLVALFFACEDEKYKNKDGEVVVFKIPVNKIKYFDSDSVSVVSNLAKLRIDRTNFANEGDYYLLHEIKEEKPYFYDDKNLTKERKKSLVSVIPVKAKLNNPRVLKQSGAFLLFGMKTLENKNDHAPLNEKWKTKSFIIKSKD